MKRRPSLWVAAGVLALAAAAYGAIRLANNDAPQASYRLARAERGSISAVVNATGTLNAVTTVQVGSQLSGQIKAIYADFNSEVKQGQPIARIDPQTYELRVVQARADLESARSNAEVARNNVLAREAELSKAKVAAMDAERDYARKRTLLERRFISDAELERTQAAAEQTRESVRVVEAQVAVQRSELSSALAQIKQREALLNAAQVDLDRTYIRAPVDGIVIQRSIDAGQTVAASLQAPTLFTIARDLRAMQVDTSIDEADVGRLRVDQETTFTVDAFPGRAFAGKITQIRKAPQVVQNVVTYTVVISTANHDLALLPGMTANVRIVVAQREDVLKVPNAALRFRPPSGNGETSGHPRASVLPGIGGQEAHAFRERLGKELNLDEGQRAQIDAAFAEASEKITSLPKYGNEYERRKHVLRIRAESRERIAAILKPDQRAAYERILAEMSSRSTTGRVWVLDGGTPRAIEVRTGVSDGSSTEIEAADFREGTEVIIGMAQTPSAQRPQAGPRLAF